MPTGRKGRLLALSLLVVALEGVYLVVVSPLLDLYAERAARLEDRRMLLPRRRARARSRSKAPVTRWLPPRCRAASRNSRPRSGQPSAAPRAFRRKRAQ